MNFKTTLLLIIVSLFNYNIYAVNKQNNDSENPPIYSEVLGKGTPILFLPGFASPGSMWKETIKNIKIKGESHLISYAGFNGKEPIEMPWYSKIKNSLIEYINKNKMSEVIIIGHSMGGNLAVDLAAALPSKISKIIIVDALACMREVMMPNVPSETLSYDSPYNKRMLEMENNQFKNMASMMASNMTYNSKKIETITNWILEADKKTWVYGYTDLLKLDLREALQKVKCKTLILGASFPNADNAKNYFEKQYSNLDNKEIIMASNSKHFIMFDEPEWFYKNVNLFLDNEAK